MSLRKMIDGRSADVKSSAQAGCCLDLLERVDNVLEKYIQISITQSCWWHLWHELNTLSKKGSPYDQ